MSLFYNLALTSDVFNIFYLISTVKQLYKSFDSFFEVITKIKMHFEFLWPLIYFSFFFYSFVPAMTKAKMPVLVIQVGLLSLSKKTSLVNIIWWAWFHMEGGVPDQSTLESTLKVS